MKYIYPILTVLAILANNCVACSCEKLNRLKRNQLNKGEVSFIGTVIEKTYVDNYTMVTRFSVDENLGGVELPAEYEIFSGRDCEPHFEPRDKWYIFATPYEGKHWSILCSRSAQLTDRDFSHVLSRYKRKVERDFNNNRKRAKREINLLRKLRA